VGDGRAKGPGWAIRSDRVGSGGIDPVGAGLARSRVGVGSARSRVSGLIVESVIVLILGTSS
jgi:hypothetical protein